MKTEVLTTALGNPRVSFSRLGYHASPNGSFERRLGGGRFPRFHAYLKERGERTEIDVHLDHKAHTYDGFRAHQAEHDSQLVEEELSRIQNAFSS